MIPSLSAKICAFASVLLSCICLKACSKTAGGSADADLHWWRSACVLDAYQVLP